MTDDIFRRENEYIKVDEFQTQKYGKLRNKTMTTYISAGKICTICGALVGQLDGRISHTQGFDQDTYNYGTIVDGEKLHEDYHKKRGDIE